MRERLEVLLRLGEECRPLLQGSDDFVERTGHLAGMAGELPARRGITRREASRQVDEVGVHGPDILVSEPGSAASEKGPYVTGSCCRPARGPAEGS